MYSSYKKKMQASRKQTRILLLTGFAFLAAAVFFFSYRFYQRIAGSSLYSIGQGNKYVNAISSKLYGSKIEEEEEESLDFSAIQTRQEEVIRNALKTLKKKREESKWSYRDPVRVAPSPDSLNGPGSRTIIPMCPSSSSLLSRTR